MASCNCAHGASCDSHDKPRYTLSIGPDERRQKVMQDAILQIAMARLLQMVQGIIETQKRLNSPAGTTHHTEIGFTAEEALYLEQLLSDLLTQPDPMTIMRG